MKTAVIKRSIFINGQKTSVSLEKEFWEGLHEIAKQENTTAPKLASQIATRRNTVNLSSAIRIFVYNYFRLLADERNADGTSLKAKATKYRALADGIIDQEARATMLRIAADYERMAELLERAPEPPAS
jgi:predicted DNA-binding ribbon-helix-helix protein